MMLKKICCILILAFEAAFAQSELPHQQAPDAPRLYFDALNFSSGVSDSSRLDLYIEVPYEGLHFIKEDEVFRARYDVYIDVEDNNDKTVFDKSWTETVETKDYEASVSPTAENLSQKSFILSPGEYSLIVQIQDDDTKKTNRAKRDVKIQNFSVNPFCLSDIMLVNRLGKEGEKKIVYPNISGNVGEYGETFYIFFEIYNHVDADSAVVWTMIKNIKGDILQHDSTMQRLAAGKTPCFIRVNSSKLLTGEYTIESQVIPEGEKVNKELANVGVISSRPFVIRWSSLPVSIAELDQAIDQLQYLTDKDTIEAMKKADPEIKRKKFFAFWKRRDPTPNTERNELMEEYYARVAYANKNFSHYLDGWKTDMGMVYIIFGPPSNVERHPFDIDSKPYEVWTYYEANREFVFVDATGFGDYRLQNPIWDVWRTRPR